LTFTLPYAGATRIRFEGLPENSGSQSVLRQTPLALLDKYQSKNIKSNKRAHGPLAGCASVQQTDFESAFLGRDDFHLQGTDALDLALNLVARLEKDRWHPRKPDA